MTKKLSWGLMAILVLCSLRLQAKEACSLPPLRHQSRDVSTILRLEEAWTQAFLRGDTELEKCLLAPDFTEILRGGQVKFFADELEMAEKNRGKNLPVPEIPKASVLLHGNVAVAYGVSKSTGPDGAPRMTRYADYYVWERGTWHAFFAQQTRVESN